MKKVCPYIVTTELVDQINYEHDDDKVDLAEEKMIKVKKVSQCLKRKCAAWQFGRCRRKA